MIRCMRPLGVKGHIKGLGVRVGIVNLIMEQITPPFAVALCPLPFTILHFGHPL